MDDSTHTFHYLVFLKLKTKSFYGVSLISTFCFNTESNFKNFIGPSESESKKEREGCLTLKQVPMLAVPLVKYKYFAR